MVVSSVMRQLQRIQRFERAVGKGAGQIGKPIFDVMDAVLAHISSEETIFERWCEGNARAEWEAHRAHHVQARLACFAMATCAEVDLPARFGELRLVLRAHARDEMRVVCALRGSVGVEWLWPLGDRGGESESIPLIPDLVMPS